MIRKIIWVFLISTFFIGFVFIISSPAREWPTVRATVWLEECSRVLPGSETPVDNSINQGNSQSPGNSGEDSIGTSEKSSPSHLEINRIIGRWLNLLHSKSKGIIKR
ncbi:MAG: hypothetical protein MUO85_10330 [candidate division Zixibacteria bacterium]|nr:hypothetical protein [candidate division Zixibacteria bacterium]